MDRNLWIAAGLLAVFSFGCALPSAGAERAPRSGECVLPMSGPVDCSSQFEVDDGRSAQPWQPCSYFASTQCPAGDSCRMGSEVGRCANTPPAE